MRNPLVSTILILLKDKPDGISEFDILQALKAQFPELNQLADDSNLQLFRQHFLIMNALYQLQASLWQDENIVLSISALQIKIIVNDQIDVAKNTELSDIADAKLSAYYLDWNEYETTDEEEVIRLIGSFYQKMNVQTDMQAALCTLNIESSNPSKAEIKKQYRKLAQKYHPDLGGDAAQFIELRQAYEQLICIYE